MARIRTIKPEFFTSEDIVSLSPLARLLYIGLWCEADREGRLAWNPRTLKRRYLPADDCDIDALARELLASGLVKVYGPRVEYACSPSFTNHQVINNRESKSLLPEPTEKELETAPDVDPWPTRESGVFHATQGKEGRKEGTKKEPPTEDAFASADPETPTGDPDRDWLWRDGTKLLAQRGLPDRKVRSCIGGWLEKSTAHQVREAVVSADRAQTGDPVPYITRILNRETRVIDAMMVGLE